MLAVAVRFPRSREADHALIAGAAALLAMRDGAPLPGLVAWHELEDFYDDFESGLPAPLIESLWRHVERRRENGGDLKLLAKAEELLHRCSVSLFAFEPVRVKPRALWSLPVRREELRFRAWRRQPGLGSWSEATPMAVADRDVLLPVARTEAIAGLPAGDWMVELSSQRTRYRSFRMVEVSDLDVITMSDGERLAMAAWRGGAPVNGANWWLRDRAEAGSGTFAGGAAVLTEKALQADRELFVTADNQRARVELDWHDATYASAERWQVHMMVDRPIHRPGEKVQGRFVLRETSRQGDGLDAVLNSKPAANQAYELRVFAEGDEVRLVGRTDENGVGSFDVAVPAPFKQGPVPVQLFIDGAEAPIYKGHPCSVVSFHRPAMLVAVLGDTAVTNEESANAAVQARWASGAPAAGLRVKAKLRVWTKNHGVRSEEHQLATDATGIATLKIPVRKLAATYVRVDFTVTMPTGIKELRHFIDVRDSVAETPRERSFRRESAPRLLVPEVVVAEESYEIGVRGKPNEQVLLVVGRGKRMRAVGLVLDADGHAAHSVTAKSDEWPALDVAVASAVNWDRERVPMLMSQRANAQITLAATAAPGAEVPVSIATGKPGTVVTVAVVDERIFGIAEDRTADPEPTLRPHVAYPKWRRAASPVAMRPEEMLRSLLEDGRVPTSEFYGSIDGRDGLPAAGGPAAPSSQDVRSDFRATAAFVTAVTGADGVATVSVPLPDDLTTWRVTVVGVATDGAGFVERRKLVTEVPLAAEPVLPRVLRVGDSIAIPVAVDRKVGTAGGAAVKLTAAVAENAANIEQSEFNVPVAEGAAASAMLKVNGVARGVASLALSASVGTHVDRSVRKLAVQPDAVLRPVSRAAMGMGKVTVDVPKVLAPDSQIEVRVLGGSSAAWAQIERRLSTYPYGCVEQTLSKLLPYFAAVRGAKVHNTEPPVADEEFRKRLRAGMKRMRQLQAGRGGAFAFWPGGKVDENMTVLVLHGLSVLRDAGHDPERFGLLCDPGREPFAGAIRKLAERKGRAATAAEMLEVELAAACLRLRPETVAAREAVLAAVQAEQPLPAGLLFRVGQALIASGERDAATDCLRRGSAPIEPVVANSGLPGDDPLAVRALQLELLCALQPNDDHAALIGEVLLGCLNGYSTTYTQATALCALALALPRSHGDTVSVKLRAGQEPKELQLHRDNGFTARVAVPFATTCSVTGAEDQQLIVQVAGHKREAGSTHAGWQNDLVVTRELCRRVINKKTKKREYRPVAPNQLHVGETVWLRLRVRAARPERYVVVDCPLPAGFELATRENRIERFDDRIALSYSYVGSRAKEFVVPVVPTMVGTMAWPPTTAAPMYADGRDAGSAGSTVTVRAGAATALLPSVVACCQQVPDAKPHTPIAPTAKSRLADAMYELRDVFGDEEYDELDVSAYRNALAAALQAALKACDGFGESTTDMWFVLEDLTDTVDTCRGNLADVERAGERYLVRVGVLLQVAERHRAFAAQMLARMTAEPKGEWDTHDVDAMVDAVIQWPDRYERQWYLAQVLQLAIARELVPQHVLDDVVGPVEIRTLRSVLLTMLATHAESHGADLLRLLPREELIGVAPDVLLKAADREWPSWVVGVLLESRAGRAELQRIVKDPALVAAHDEALLAGVPRGYWRSAPLAAFEGISGAEIDGFDLVSMIATSEVPSSDMQRDVLRSWNGQWRSTLVRALLQRGVRELGPIGADEDDSDEAWRQAIKLRHDDAASALQLHQHVVDDIGSDALCRFLRETIVRAGTVTELASVAEYLEEDETAAMFARLGSVEARALLGLVTEPLERLPVARERADCLALWRYADRLEEHDRVLEALCRTVAGLHFAERTIAAVADEKQRASLHETLWELQGLDYDTGLPPIHEPWLPLLLAVQQRGVPTTWSPQQRSQYDQLRLLRGVR